MTGMLGACDTSELEGNSTFEGSDDNGFNKCCFGGTIQARFEDVFFYGIEILKLSTDDKIVDFISLMGNNMLPTAKVTGKNTHFSYRTITISMKTIKSRNELQ